MSQFIFTYHYGNGDSYTGIVSAAPETYSVGQIIAGIDNQQGSQQGYYTIDGFSEEDNSSNGQVILTSYTDADTGFGNVTNLWGYGYSGLGSEYGYVYNTNYSESRYFTNYYEADLPALLQIRLNWLADNNGIPGAVIDNHQLSLGNSFFVEVLVGDFRPNAVGVIGLDLDLAWDGILLDSVNFSPSTAITSQFPLLQGGTLVNDGLIDDLAGGSLPELELGQAVGVNQLERFALLHFSTENLTNGTAYLTTTLNQVSLADDNPYYSLDVETLQPFEIINPLVKYNFVYYYSGDRQDTSVDYYTGYIYATNNTYQVNSYVDIFGNNNETGNIGRYFIESVEANDGGTEGYVNVTNYYDINQDTDGFGNSLNGQAFWVYGYGYSGLGSEWGYAYNDNYEWTNDNYFTVNNSADLVGNNVYFSFTYYYGDGDYYSGYGYADRGYINAPGIYSALNLSNINDTGNIGYYEVTSVQGVGDLGLRDTATYLWVDRYYDAQTDLDGVEIGGYGLAYTAYSYNGYNGLGSEEGYAYNAGFEGNDNFFNSLNSADINTDKTYLSLRNADEDWWIQSRFEGNEGESVVYTFEVVRQGRIDSSLSVNWAIEGAGITQADANDFVNGVLPSGTVTFAPGESVVSFTVLVRGDDVLETAEGFQARISNPDTNTITLTTDYAQAQIFNDDGFDVGWAFGDPHLITLDGLGYDFMAVGEFVLIETLPEATNPFQVQVRYEPYPGSEVVSIATRMAVKVGDRRIELRLGEDPLLVDGFAVPIDSIPGGLDINGDGRLDLTKDTSKDNRYILFLNDLGEQVVVDIYDSFMDVNVLVSQDRDGAVRGLLGDSDGNPDNDLRGRDGTLYSQPIAFTDLYGAFADSWRVDTVGTGNNKDSLFSYDVDEGVGSFDRNDFPKGSLDLSLVPPDLLAEATAAVEAAGIVDPLLQQAAIYDYFLTGDGAFLNSAANSPSIPTTSGTLDTNSIPVIASVGVTAEQASVMEGESGSSKILTFRFWRTDSSSVLTINYRLEGTINAEDLSPGTAFTGSLSFVEGVNEQLLAVTLLGDSLIETDEQLVMAIADENLGATTIAAGQAITTITNDDFPSVTINDIAGDNVVNGTEKAAGISITGTATTLTQVRVGVGSQSKTVAVNGDGVWSANFTAQELPGDGSTNIVAIGLDALGNETAPTSRSLRLDTTPPALPVIDPITGDDLIGPSEKSGDITITGTAEENTQVNLTFGSVTRTVTSINGRWLATIGMADIPNTGVVSLTATATDSAGNISAIAVKSVSIGSNNAPVDLALSATTVDENVAANTVIGTLSSTDPDAGDNFTYSLVAGTGDTDNAAFSIVGNQLQINNSPDFETQNNYSIRVKTTDQGGLGFEKVLTITVNDLNETPSNQSPTDLVISATTVDENVPANTVIGTLSTTDPNTGDSFTYSLVAGDGATDNSAFSIVGNQLQINNSPDFETKNSYSIRVKTTDADGLGFEKTLTITVDNVNETPGNQSPTDVALSATTVDENVAANTVIGTLSTTDPDTGDSFTYSLVAGDGATDNSVFSIVGNQLQINNSPDFEAKNSYSIRVKTTDADGLGFEKTLTITVDNVNETPTDLAISATTVDENVAANTVIGTLSSTDPDAGDSFTYSLVAGTGDTDNAAFSIVGNQLQINNSPDFETQNNYSIRVKTTDQGGLSFEQVLTITVNNVNEAPTDLIFQNVVTELAEDANVTPELKVADLTIEDDGLGTNNLFLTGRDRDRFLIRDLALYYVGGTLNFEAQNRYEVTVNADDETLGTTPDLAQNFTLAIADVNEAPTAVILTNTTQTLIENTDTSQGVKVADIQVTDDALGTNSLSLLGNDQGSFEVRGQELFFIGKADFEAQNLYDLTVAVTDTTLKPAPNATPDATVNFTLEITNLPDQTVSPQTLQFANAGNGQGALVLDFSNLPGTVQVKADEEGLKQTGAFFNNIVGLYKVVDGNGAVLDILDLDDDGNVTELIQPGETGYARTALSQAVNNFILRASGEGSQSSTTATEFGDVLLEGGQRYAPFVIANGGNLGGGLQESIQAFLGKNPDNTAATLENFMTHEVAYFSFGAANPDGAEHLRDRGNNTFGFEDLPGNLTNISDNDFNDGILAFTFMG